MNVALPIATNATRSRWGVALRRAAWIAFVALVIVSPFRGSIGIVDGPAAAPTVVMSWSLAALFVTLGLWILSLALLPRRIRFGPRFLAVPVVGLLVVAWLGIPFSADVTASGEGALRLALVAALGVYILNEVDGVKALAVPLMVMVGVQAVVAIGQVVGQGSVGLAILGEQPNLVPSDGGISIVASADGVRWLRAYGLTDHPNVLGGILAFVLILIGSTLRAGGGRSLGRWVVFGVGIATLFLTFSRAAWMAYAIGIVVGAAMLAAMGDRARIRRWALTAGVAAVVCTPLVLVFAPFVGARITAVGPVPAEARSIDERFALADGAIRVIAERPLLGSGIGTLPSVMVLSQPGFDPRQAAHIVVLDVAAETGIIGGICYLVLMLAPWVAVLRSRTRWTSGLVAASAALAAVITVGFFDHYTWTTSGGLIWVVLALGLWATAYGSAIAVDPDA